MELKDAELLENLLEEFIEKSEYCENCKLKRYNDEEDRYFCYFGIKCICEQFLQ